MSSCRRRCFATSDTHGWEAFSTFAGEQDNLTDDPQDPSRKLIRTILGAVADYERELTKLRLHNGRRRKAVCGGYAYGEPPYGWKAADKSLVPIAAEQATLSVMHELRGQGRSFAYIADRLNETGTPARRGRWHPQTVSRALARGPVSTVLGVH
jgi:DNA invertase Pin-like site-specific DNA recombinase